ncbi:MAG TPA: MFS transporter [Solirubrobacteraceae bacterium]|nr:MFS transporter [Solirubrobacteraceae bacterium]
MRRLVWLIGAVVLVDTMFYAAITPLLPELADSLDVGKGGAGVLLAAYAAGTLVGSLPGGWLAARVGVRATVLVGLTLMAASGLTFAFAQSIMLLDAARFLQGVGGACSWAGGMAWLAAATPPARRGGVIGTALGAAIFGVQLGPVLGALATAVGHAPAFASAAVLGAALAAWARATPAPAGGRSAPATPLRALRDARMRAGMAVTALPAAAFGVLDVLAPLRLDALGAGGLAIGAVFFVAAAVEGLVSPAAGRAYDRLGAAVVVPAGLAASGAGLLLLLVPGAVVPFAAVVVLAAGALGMLWAPAGGMLSHAADRIGLEQGYAFAFFNLAWAGGFMIGAAAGGGAAGAVGDALPYAALAGGFGVAAAVARGASRRDRALRSTA